MRSILSVAFCGALLASGVAARATTTGPMPSCRAGDPVVWVNTSSKVYHLQGDQYYGNTKHGQYECKSAADAAGDHLSKQKNASGTSAPSSKATPRGAPTPRASAPAAVPSPTSTGSKHHHHRSSKASPSPAPAAS